MMVRGDMTHIPCTLLPTPFPRAAFHRLEAMAPIFNRLYQRVSREPAFLSDCLADIGRTDPFIGRLLSISQRVDREGHGQSLQLSINRSDYMLHAGDDGSFVPQQVELNTISAGLGSLSSRVANMHRFLVTRHAPQYADPVNLPPNPALDRIVRAMASAVSLYEAQQAALGFESGEGRAALLMVVQPGEWNIVDQQLLSHDLWRLHSIPTVRRTLAELAVEAVVDEGRRLSIGGQPIALAYFRAGYTPRDYPTDGEWEALYSIERSAAIKCPTVAYHLAGCKRVQQVLSDPAQLQRFLSPDEATVILPSFTGLWGLDPHEPHTPVMVAAALADPTSYVLKPQREGGGNNLWGREMVDKLRSGSAEEVATYILMRRIRVPAATAAGVKRGELHSFRGCSEMGIFGLWLSDGDEVHLNESAGYLLRTKSVDNVEGGISAGAGFLDSAVLV